MTQTYRNDKNPFNMISSCTVQHVPLSATGIFHDPHLLPYADIIQQRLKYIHKKEKEIISGDKSHNKNKNLFEKSNCRSHKSYGKNNEIIKNNGKSDKCENSLYEFSDYHKFFGLHFHKHKQKWVFREWAPNADSVYIIGEMTKWQCHDGFSLTRTDNNGIWEKYFDAKVFSHRDLYRLHIKWEKGNGDRIPTAATRVVQDPETLIFNAEVWNPPESYKWRHPFIDNACLKKESNTPLLIYEAHPGMAQEQGRIGTFKEFENNILPEIKEAGYNAVQLMAVQEHPYYGSFGYHVSNFYAPSSRFGTPEDLKSLIDTAHLLGIKVFMDIIHSHAVNNEVEGISRFDGTLHQFFHKGEKGYHRLWDSRCFDYGKNMVVKFLLSNCRYWMEEFKVDGFRFDGVTSMLFSDHGLNRAFTSYGDYYKENDLDLDALSYLFMANKLIHQISPYAVTIAEDVSGYPGIAASSDKGGTGFDFRFAMGLPDFWIKLLKEYSDENWPLGRLWHELNSRRNEEKSISYAESHDQALVGDQTIMMRLMGKDIYSSMAKHTANIKTFRAVALHKMIRLITFATAGNGYLNFMGNEFGHPEWIDFPGEHNNWSYHYARRQWSLKHNKTLFFHDLAYFDREMLKLTEKYAVQDGTRPDLMHIHENNRIIAFKRHNLIFVFNFNASSSFTDYLIDAPPGKYKMILNTDEDRFGGKHRLKPDQIHFTIRDSEQCGKNFEQCRCRDMLSLYLPTRTALVLKFM